MVLALERQTTKNGRSRIDGTEKIFASTEDKAPRRMDTTTNKGTAETTEAATASSGQSVAALQRRRPWLNTRPWREKQVLAYVVTLMITRRCSLVTLMLTRRCSSNIYAHQPVPQPVLSELKHLCLDDVSWARAGEKAKLLR